MTGAVSAAEVFQAYIEVAAHLTDRKVLGRLSEAGPQRFSELLGATAVNPAQLDRSLKSLRRQLFIVASARSLPSERIAIHYEISARGKKLLDASRAFERVILQTR